MFKKLCLNVIGYTSVGLAFAGAFLPLLPTTPFLLLAAGCFSTTSPKMRKWLYTNRWFGESFSRYHRGEGMLLPVKIKAVIFLWLALGISALFAVPSHLVFVKVLLLIIGIGVTTHLLWIKTYRK